LVHGTVNEIFVVIYLDFWSKSSNVYNTTKAKYLAKLCFLKSFTIH